MAERLTIPGIGTFRPTFDRISISSDLPRDALRLALPVADLKASAHAFTIERESWSRGRLAFTCLPDGAVLQLLQRHEAALGGYRVTKVEVAYDIPVASLAEAKHVRDWLVMRLGKRNHSRGFITFIDTNSKGDRLTLEERVRRGLVDEPTVYFEEKNAAHNLKLYIRQEKLARRQYGQLVVRLEWTSTRSRAVAAHLGGNQLSDLLKLDLADHLRRFLVLEELDHAQLGRLTWERGNICHRRQGAVAGNRSPAVERLYRQFNDEDYRARRRANLVIMLLEERAWPEYANDEPIPEEAWRSSPAQIKGRFHAHFAKMRKKAQRSRDKRTRYRTTLTMKKLEECFKPIPLRKLRIRLARSRPVRP